MKFEHFALNVPEPQAMAKWYVDQCGMRVVVASEKPPYGHFLADESGRVVLELYLNHAAPIPDYRGQHPLCFHFAFAVDNARASQERMVAAGAKLVEEINLEDGSCIFMLRDPWGVPFQLCQRTTPLV